MRSPVLTVFLVCLTIGIAAASAKDVVAAGRQYVLSLIPNYEVKKQSCPHVIDDWALCNYSDTKSAVTVILHEVNGNWNGVGKYGGVMSASDLQATYGIPPSIAEQLAK